MMNCQTICALAEEHIAPLRKEWLSKEDSSIACFLDDLNCFLPLQLPYPAGYCIKISGYCDYYDEDNHIEVFIYDSNGKKVESSRTCADSVSIEDVNYAISQALHRLSLSGWNMQDVRNAWSVYSQMMKKNQRSERKLPDWFLHFAPGTDCSEVEAFFEKQYPGGAEALAAGVVADDIKKAAVNLRVEMTFTEHERNILLNGTQMEKQNLICSKVINSQFSMHSAYLGLTLHHAHKQGYEWYLPKSITIPLTQQAKDKKADERSNT